MPDPSFICLFAVAVFTHVNASGQMYGVMHEGTSALSVRKGLQSGFTVQQMQCIDEQYVATKRSLWPWQYSWCWGSLH